MGDLRRPVMEVVGYRTDVLGLDGLADETRAYLDWLLGEGAAKGAKAKAMMAPEALDLLAARLATPL
jgi:type II secretory pathway predicted ATPase ExeA